jgi:hypothetical protein
LASDPPHLEAALEKISSRFGAPVLARDPFPFTFTDYYVPQTGDSAIKKFLVYPPRSPDLVSWKHWAVESEGAIARTSVSGLPRPVNIDPGTLGPGNLILASTKEAPHRVHLDRAIFAQLELIYQHGAFTPLPWTYPDYRTDEALAFFSEARALLKRMTK